MSRRKKIYTKFFPFSPRIPWKIGKGSAIIPEIDYFLLEELLKNKNITIIGFGGLIETFFSLSILEALSNLNINCNLFSKAHDAFYDLVRAQGLAKPNPINLTKDILDKYPIYLFFDKSGNAYFNYLYNYLIRKSYWGQHPEIRHDPILKQLFDNSLLQWNYNIPQLRNLNTSLSNGYKKWRKLQKMRENRKFIVIFPDKSYGMHEISCFDWSTHNIREFSALMYGKGVDVVVCTENARKYYGTEIKVEPSKDIMTKINLVKDSWLIISREIDWYLIGLCISKATLLLQNVDGAFDIFKNAEFVGADNVILMDENWISPMEAHNICQGLKCQLPPSKDGSL